jgi:uncharacterized protein YjiS (DUF1127 family)
LIVVRRTIILDLSGEKERATGSRRDRSNDGRRHDEKKEPTMAFEFVRQYFENRRVYLRTLRELSSCSDRELHDLGIERGDIEHIARQSARG